MPQIAKPWSTDVLEYYGSLILFQEMRWEA